MIAEVLVKPLSLMILKKNASIHPFLPHVFRGIEREHWEKNGLKPRYVLSLVYKT